MGRDLRRYGRQTNIRLFGGFIILLLVIGGGLVFIIYGPAALPAYLLCLGAGLVPLLLIVLILFGLDWIVRRSSREQ